MPVSKPALTPAGLYVHIPFCRSICAYCDFPRVQADDAPLDRYVRAVGDEIRRSPERGAFRAVTLFFGGGTPSLLAPRHVERIVDAATEAFDLAPDAEVTLECNPGDVGPDVLAGYRAAGANRVSLGVQSLRDDLLGFLGRRHDAATARRAYEDARAAGFENVSVDLIYAVPGQTPRAWREDLAEIRAWAPEHVSAYALSMEEGAALTAQWKAGEVILPDEDAALAMWEALDALDGWERYEISNLARPGRRAAHNVLYWSWETYLGFGAAAHAFVPDARDGGRRWANVAAPERYMAAVERRDAPRVREDVLTPGDACTEYLMTRLRLTEGFPDADFAARFGASVTALAADAWAPAARAGLVRSDDGRIVLTDAGRRISDSLVASLALEAASRLTSHGAKSSLWTVADFA